ncbi:uncharacterized protein LOC127849052 [Dreissena polymorpha]|uniref:uncharacterized protein LOC127849052 n=1 Tax=Dreissena polymorpha TaxID=45954 RepID=UPI002265097D|nr:uncharacterized protein LOC127849052 [Dreissena polymorpha]
MEKWPIAKSKLDKLEQCGEHSDEKIKLFCEDHRKLCCHICVALHHSEVAVTTNESSSDDGLHGLHIISVRNDRLEKGRKLQLSHKCVGIAHHEDALYVTFGTALYQYTLNGNLVKELYEDTTGYNTVYSCAVNLKSDKIYVTSLHKHSLLTLDKDGNAISTFTDIDLKGPQGVHVTPSGQVLVCGETTHTIIQVDSDGKKKLATLATKKDGINGPRERMEKWPIAKSTLDLLEKCGEHSDETKNCSVRTIANCVVLFAWYNFTAVVGREQDYTSEEGEFDPRSGQIT